MIPKYVELYSYRLSKETRESLRNLLGSYPILEPRHSNVPRDKLLGSFYKMDNTNKLPLQKILAEFQHEFPDILILPEEEQVPEITQTALPSLEKLAGK